VSRDRCPECRKSLPYVIENGQCIECHDRTYNAALGREDEASQSIVEEYRLTARQVLDSQSVAPEVG
jgi:hypothetical protein